MVSLRPRWSPGRRPSTRCPPDAIGRFIKDRIHLSQFAHVRARELFGAWASWCHENGEVPGSEVEFAAAMERRGFEKTDRNVGRVYLGLQLLAADTAEGGA